MGIRTLRCRTATTLDALLPAGLRRVSVYAPDVSTARVPAEPATLRFPRHLARAAAGATRTAGPRAAAR